MTMISDDFPDNFHGRFFNEPVAHDGNEFRLAIVGSASFVAKISDILRERGSNSATGSGQRRQNDAAEVPG